MKTFSAKLILSALWCTTILMPAADETSGSWSECFKQYAWPQGHNILFDPNCRETGSGNNWTPLHVAVTHGYPDLVQALLENGAAQVTDANGQLPYELALHPDAVERHYQYTSARELADKVWLASPIRCRFIWGNADILANPNRRFYISEDRNSCPVPIAVSGTNWTPLHFAIVFKDASLVRELLKRGALPLRALLISDRRELFPHEVQLFYPGREAEYKHARTLLRAAFKMQSPMHVAIQDHNPEAVSKLAEIDPTSVNAIDISKRTPLMHLIIAHDCQATHDDAALLETIKTLLKHGAKTDCIDSFGKKALEYARTLNMAPETHEAVLTLLA